MKRKVFAIVFGAYLCACFLSAAEENIPFRVVRISDRITVFVPGKYAPPASMAVITTKKGLIVIDTLLSPTLARLALKEMKKELGRDDVILVINTHDHGDHTNGNQVFQGVDIVGHMNAVQAMERSAAGLAAQLQRTRMRIFQNEGKLRALAPGSPEAPALSETVQLDRMVLDDMEKIYKSTPPTKTFADKLVLEAGGLELRLYYFGRAHSGDDIVIHVPALKALFTGDLFHPDFIGVTANAGALEVPRWLAVLGDVLKTGNGVRTIVGGHNLTYTRSWLDAQRRYLEDLWNAVTQAKKDDASLAAKREMLPLEPTFSFLAPLFDLKAQPQINQHQANIQAFWRVGLASAAAEIERVMGQSGVNPARACFAGLLAAGERKLFIDEQEFNALGYRFIQAGKTAEAIAVFTMNSEAFPRAWNAWDSLGEAWLAQNEFDKAEDCYKKSLVLNPASQSGRNSLDRIRLDYRNETKEALKFAPGQPTKLKGPYLGQTPPGLEAKVFAPGIVSSAGNFEFSIAFTPDGREVYFVRRQDPGGTNTMMVSRWEKDGWTAPEEAAFCKGFPSNEPHITADGKKLYFGCNRRRPGSERPEYGIWVAERTANGWGEPRYHGPGMYVSSTARGDLYMTDVSNAAGGGLIRYPLLDGATGAPERIVGAVNEPTWTAHAFVAPDEKYIVFDTYSRPGGQGGEGDLYAVFRAADGSWSDAFNLGDSINTPGTNFCPMVSPDGKYLFYAMCRDIYWVSAEVIHRLRPGAAPRALLNDEIKSVALTGDLPKLQSLLAKDPALIKAGDAQGRTLLHLAAAAGSPEMARWLIGQGAAVDGRTTEMSTPLMHAALYGKGDFARQLIAQGADPGARDSYQRTALILVGRQTGDPVMAGILIDSGADVNAVDRFKDSALSLAAWRGFAGLVDLLLKRGATLPADRDRKQYLLSMAVANGLDSLFDRLLASGADLSAKDGVGGSMLHAAADGGSERIVSALIGNKLDPNVKDGNGWTPLHRAAERGNIQAAATLIAHGARLDDRTLAGETPLNLAVDENNTEMTALLRSRGADSSPARFPELKGEYLGQKKPGAVPELFAPGIVSARFGLHCPAVFSPDGREAYWNVMVKPRTPGTGISRLLFSRLRDGRWTRPQAAPFTDEGRDGDVPCFTPDGKRLYFMSRRPLPGAGPGSGEHIWFMERRADGWSEAQPVDETVNGFPHHWQFSVDKDYNLYFSTTVSNGQGANDIYCSRYRNGRYAEPQNLGAPVNSPGREEMPFIAPDGSYLLFAREMDLYVSFRQPDGAWGQPAGLGPEINSPAIDICPMVSADGRYLFFLSQRGGESHAWWVDAKALEKMKPQGSAPGR
jgi:ankyrin repeat protein/glyoxylase-like metal-dependent hydrolase (beta-lactamase superfamily II)